MVSRLRPRHTNGLGLLGSPLTRQPEASPAGASWTGLTGPWCLSTLPACVKGGHIGDCGQTAERVLGEGQEGSPLGSPLEPIKAALSKRAGFWLAVGGCKHWHFDHTAAPLASRKSTVALTKVDDRSSRFPSPRVVTRKIMLLRRGIKAGLDVTHCGGS